MKDAIITAAALVNLPLGCLLGKFAVETAVRKIGAPGRGLFTSCATSLTTDFASENVVEVGH